MARKVVGVGSVGTRAWVILMMGRDGQDPLFMQAKEAEASVLEPYVGESEFENHGERVVEGQWLMQAASDILLGWLPANGFDDQERDFYVRQLWDGKRSVDVETMPPEGLAIYGRVCGWTLARAHARSGDRIAIGSYLGKGETFDQAIADFSELYADQNELDYARSPTRPSRAGSRWRRTSTKGGRSRWLAGRRVRGDWEWRSSAGACGDSEREPDSEEAASECRHGRRTVTMQHSPLPRFAALLVRARRRSRVRAVGLSWSEPVSAESHERKLEMADRPVFLYAAVYDEIADAEADYEAVFDLHAAGAIGTFDSAVIRKEEDGKVRVTKTEKPTQHGAWTGAGVGALVGIIFPPAIIGAAVVGAGAGGLIGHLRGGVSRDDLKELGDALEEGNAAVIVIGESKIEEQLEKATTRANKLIEKQIDADADELKREIDAAAKEDAK